MNTGSSRLWKGRGGQTGWNYWKWEARELDLKLYLLTVIYLGYMLHTNTANILFSLRLRKCQLFISNNIVNIIIIIIVFILSGFRDNESSRAKASSSYPLFLTFMRSSILFPPYPQN